MLGQGALGEPAAINNLNLLTSHCLLAAPPRCWWEMSEQTHTHTHIDYDLSTTADPVTDPASHLLYGSLSLQISFLTFGTGCFKVSKGWLLSALFTFSPESLPLHQTTLLPLIELFSSNPLIFSDPFSPRLTLPAFGETVAFHQSRFRSVLVFLQTRLTSSLIARVWFQSKEHKSSRNRNKISYLNGLREARNQENWGI